MRIVRSLFVSVLWLAASQLGAQLQPTVPREAAALAAPTRVGAVALEVAIAPDKLEALELAGMTAAWPDAYALAGEEDVTVAAFTEPGGSVLLVYNVRERDHHVFVRVTNGGTANAELRIWSSGPSELVIRGNEVTLQETPSDDTIRFDVRSDISALDAIACIARNLGATITPAFLDTYLSAQACSATSSIALALTAYTCLSIPAPAAIVGCVNGIARLISCSFVSCASCSITTTSIGRNESASWSSTCRSQQTSSSYARFYSFTLSRRQAVDLSATSSTADPVLYLRRGNATTSPVVTSNDNGGGGVNARIRTTLDAGTYVIEVISKGTDRAGSFTLTLR